ncbi:MAG: protein kinase [Polyangiaceae bacterium]|nr:protein kinase [Polyangiaceae bacterium]
MHPALETLRAELERLCEIDELDELARTVLGDRQADALGGSNSKAARAGALLGACRQARATEALCDALVAQHEAVSPEISQLRLLGLEGESRLDAGASLGSFAIVAEFGNGRLSTSYHAERDGVAVRLRCYSSGACRDISGLNRSLTQLRLMRRIQHPALPADVQIERAAGQTLVAHSLFDGVSLDQYLAATGPLSFADSAPILSRIADGLSALHSSRLAHGNLSPSNVLINTRGEVCLLDSGAQFLRLRAPKQNGQLIAMNLPGDSRCLAPELIAGELPTPASDLYALGCLHFLLLTGQAPFTGAPSEQIVGHLHSPPPDPRRQLPNAGFTAVQSECVQSLLAKQPSERPASAEDLLGELDRLLSAPMTIACAVTDDELNQMAEEIVTNPWDEEALDRLADSTKREAEPARVISLLQHAARQLNGDEGPAVQRAILNIHRRAGSVAENSKQFEAAEEIYRHLHVLDKSNDEILTALTRVRCQLGRHEEIIERLLAEVDAATSAVTRAAALGRIGEIYQLADESDQALVAYAQAFVSLPSVEAYARAIEELAGSHDDAWAEALSSCVEVAEANELAPDEKRHLLLQMSVWYVERLGRGDLSVPCYRQLLSDDPTDVAAIDGLCAVLRESQQWTELGTILLAGAAASGNSGPRSRQLLFEAAEMLESKLNNPVGACELYERIHNEDPTHEGAGAALERLYERAGNSDAKVRLLAERAGSLRGEERLTALCSLAVTYENELDRLEEAETRFSEALKESPLWLDALRGLDRIYTRTHRYHELAQNLTQQVTAATTPRQQITLHERIATIAADEFLDHEAAATAWTCVLDLDGDHLAALAGLSRHYRALERYEDLLPVLEQHIKLLVDRSLRLSKLVELASVLDQLGIPERAIAVLEEALDVDPKHAAALESLAKLQAQGGDADRAVEAIDALARAAGNDTERAEHYLRAATLLDNQELPQEAIEHYKLALDAMPSDRKIAERLRAAYTTTGDPNSAAELFEREIADTEGKAQGARLRGQLAQLCLSSLDDTERARTNANAAMKLDPTNLEALRVLGDIASNEENFNEAITHYEQVISHADSLSKLDASRLSERYTTALLSSGQKQKGLAAADAWLVRDHDQYEVVLRVADICFEHAAPQRAYDLYADLRHRFESSLIDEDLAHLSYRLGESARRTGQLEIAFSELQRAVSLDATTPQPIESIAKIHEAREQWEDAVRLMYEQAELETGDARVEIFIKIGDLAAAKLGDPNYAAESYLFALSERRGDRKILTKLMQLYSEGKDWGMLIKVILKLAKGVDDVPQRAKYLHTAAMVAKREMGDTNLAGQLLEQAIELVPDFSDGLQTAAEIYRSTGQFEKLKSILKMTAGAAANSKDNALLLPTLTELAELYEYTLGQVDQAIAVYESAQKIEPDNWPRNHHLYELYSANTGRYLQQALKSQYRILDGDSFNPDACRALRGLYTDAKHTDGAWAMCQALALLDQADAEESAFFNSLRSEDAATLQNRISDEDWQTRLIHPQVNTVLTSVFALIEATFLKVRAKTAPQLGFTPADVIDASTSNEIAVRSIVYAADCLGVPEPPLLGKLEIAGELSIVNTTPPALVLGDAVLGVAVAVQAGAFMSARILTSFRPGFFIRHLMPSSAGLKAVLFAAIRLVMPKFPIPPKLKQAVGGASTALAQTIQGDARAKLKKLVKQLIEAEELDIKRWMAGVDYTADRAAFLMCNDLEVAVSIIRASQKGAASVAPEERVEAIFRFAGSMEYIDLRSRLGIVSHS